MKIGRKNAGGEVKVSGGGKPAANSAKRTLLIVLVAVLAAAIIAWVWMMGKKAEQTVTVAVWTQPIYKNQVITLDMLEPYDMLLGEYEKRAIIDNNNGTTSRRVLLWEEAPSVTGCFAAYPLQAGSYVEYRDLITSRLDNSDSVLYSFPGKEIISLDIAGQDLTSFKTFLEPGDRINIEAIYSEDVDVSSTDAYGNTITNKVTAFRTETIFGDIMVADMLNSSGESILDIYASYNDMTVAQQAQLDASADFKANTEPQSLLVALTPEEKDRYYYYISKGDIEFRISMPQRLD